MIKAVLFDMDGVLAFTETFYNRRRVSFLRSRGVEVDPEFDGTGSNDGEIWERLVPDEGLREGLRRDYRAYSDRHPTPWREVVNPQAAGVIRSLHEAGVLTAVCSSSYRSLIEEFVGSAGLAGSLDYVISGEECSAYKPDPEIYLRAMERLGVAPSEALVVEDSPIGIEAGVASGALTCALVPPRGVELDQDAAHLRIESLEAVRRVVDATARTTRRV